MISNLRALVSRLRALFTIRRLDDDFAEELESHLALLTDENIREGMPEAEAKRAAALKLGSQTTLREEHHEQRTILWLESVAQDVRFALRMLRKNPAFTAVAVLTLALGIGANTAIFSVAYAVLFRPLPYPSSSRLVDVGQTEKYEDQLSSGPPQPSVRAVLLGDRVVFADAAAYESRRFIWTDQAAPEYLTGAAVTGNFFSLLGVQPLLGRPILPQDLDDGSEPAVVLGYSIWKDSFGGNASILGQRIVLDRNQYTVVGVMPPEFEFPFDAELGQPRCLWISAPIASAAKSAGDDTARMIVVARLKNGVSLPEANSRLHNLALQLVAGHAEGAEHLTDLEASSVEQYVGWQVRPALLILLGAAAFVLLIACVNVSALLMARSWVRRGEVAIRAALGASRFRLVRQLLTESVMLSLAGGALGLLFALWGVQAIRAVAPADTPRIAQAGVYAPVVWFTLGLSVLAGLLYGLAPALQVSASRLGMALKPGQPGALHGMFERRPRRIRNVLVVAEVALAVVLVTGALLMARSLEKLASLQLGIRVDRVVAMEVDFTKSVCEMGKPIVGTCTAAINDVIRRVEGIPGVDKAATADGTPADSGVALSGHLALNGGLPTQSRAFVDFSTVSPDYFSALDIRLLQGRDFDEKDGAGAPHVVIVNQSFARRYLSGNPLGQRISLFEDKNHQQEWMDIVGEAADSRDKIVYFNPSPAIYTPFAQAETFFGATLIVHTMEDPGAIIPAIRQRIWSVDKGAPITKIRTEQQVISDVEAPWRFHMAMFGSFGALGLLLALMGTYGVISYTVVQRTHEIGIRIALGARSSDVLRLMLAEGMLLAGTGIAIGIAGSFALTRLIGSFLFDVTPTDPPTFIAVVLLLASSALLAWYIPSRRAMRVDPVSAMRCE